MDQSRSQLALPYSGFRILVADDNAINCQIAKRLFETLGCEVELAASGQQVLSMHAQKPYDLILMDCQMPDLNGYAACSQLRNIEGCDRHTPVIGWTANAQQEEIERCSAAGMDDCLSKHLRLDGLEYMLASWLKPGSAPAVSLHPADLSGLESMHRISGAGFAELVGLFEEDMPQRISDLKRALHASDYRSASRIAHMMSGCCASIGAMHLSDLCHRLELQTESSPSDESVLTQLNAVEQAYQQVLVTLHALKNQAPAAN